MAIPSHTLCVASDTTNTILAGVAVYHLFNVLAHTEYMHRDYPSSRDSLNQTSAKIDVLIRPHMALVISPIEFCQLDFHWADGDCHYEPTDDIIILMTS